MRPSRGSNLQYSFSTTSNIAASCLHPAGLAHRVVSKSEAGTAKKVMQLIRRLAQMGGASPLQT